MTVTTIFDCNECNREFEMTEDEFIYSLSIGERPHGMFCSDQCRTEYKNGTSILLLQNRYRNFYANVRSVGRRINDSVAFWQTGKIPFHKIKRMNFDQRFLAEMYEKQNGLCLISKIKMIYADENENNESETVSVDRIVSSNKHYLRDNVQLLCYAFNLAKNDSDNDRFFTFFENVKRANDLPAKKKTFFNSIEDFFE